MSNTQSPPETVIARWQTKGNDYLELKRGETEDSYWYKGNGCFGGFYAKTDSEAIERMEAPWGDPRGAGQCTVLKSDRPSLKRVK